MKKQARPAAQLCSTALHRGTSAALYRGTSAALHRGTAACRCIRRSHPAPLRPPPLHPSSAPALRPLCTRSAPLWQGAIILGIGGDNSAGAVGTFYEGAMLKGYTTDATDDAMQANIVAAGYGSAVLRS